jgi:hypothetical protein
MVNCSVRFDGLYSWFDGALWRHARFFPSGKVAWTLINANPHDCIEYLTEEFCEQSGGAYEIDGSSISVVITQQVQDDEPVIVEYEGEVHSDRLKLKFFSRNTGYSSSSTYQFVWVADTKSAIMDRVEWIQNRLGFELPPSVIQHFVTHRPLSQSNLACPSPNGSFLVRESFVLNSGHKDRQVDRVYSLTFDALPRGVLPIACDWVSNQYCVVVSERGFGKVAFWDYSQDPDECELEFVASSIEEFFAKLVPEEDEPDK